MIVTVAAIMVTKLTTARIEQRFCLSCWSSWSWSSRDMIQVLSGSDIIVAVPDGIRAWGMKNANNTQFLQVGKKKSTWEDQTEHKYLVEDGNISLGASNPSSKLELNCEDEDADQQCDRHHGGPHCSWHHPYWTITGCFSYSYTTLLEVQKRNHPIISKNVNINKRRHFLSNTDIKRINCPGGGRCYL